MYIVRKTSQNYTVCIVHRTLPYGAIAAFGVHPQRPAIPSATAEHHRHRRRGRALACGHRHRQSHRYAPPQRAGRHTQGALHRVRLYPRRRVRRRPAAGHIRHVAAHPGDAQPLPVVPVDHPGRADHRALLHPVGTDRPERHRRSRAPRGGVYARIGAAEPRAADLVQARTRKHHHHLARAEGGAV